MDISRQEYPALLVRTGVFALSIHAAADGVCRRQISSLSRLSTSSTIGST